MNWENILTEVILSILGIVLSGLGALATYWISKLIKNDKLKTIINSLNDIVKKATLEVYQTYVEELKEKNIFDREAQKTALSKALKIIETNLPSDVSKWLEDNFTDVREYLKGLIEAQIALLKK